MSDDNRTDPAVIAHIRRRRAFERMCEARGRLETRRARMEEDQAEASYAETAPTTEWGAELHIFRALRGLKCKEEGAEGGQCLDAFAPTIDALRMYRAADPEALPMLRLALETVETFEMPHLVLDLEAAHLRHALDFLSRSRTVA